MAGVRQEKRGKLLLMQRLMPDSRLNETERPLQQTFSKSFIFSSLLLAGLILLTQAWMDSLRTLSDSTPRDVELRFSPAGLEAARFAPLRLAGAWRLDADDPRFGGVSALALDGAGLVALSDSGSLLRFARPGGGISRVRIRGLPGGPGPANRKIGRDSESLARAPDGRGWWVGFEQRHALFRFDASFGRVLGRVDLGARWPDNGGVEAMAVIPAGLLLIPEAGETVIQLGAGGARESALSGGGPVSDAAVLPDGRILLLLRRVTPLGLSNALALLERDGSGYRLSRPMPLPLGRLDNGEAMAAEALPGGAVRLWLMTDNDFRRSVQTLLVAIDIPRGAFKAGRAAP